MKSLNIFLVLISSSITLCTTQIFALPSGPLKSTSSIPGTVEKISSDSITIDSSIGKVTAPLGANMQFYKRVPSDLSHITAKSFVGVTTVKQADGKEVATEIHIFPDVLRGTNEGSWMMDMPADAKGPQSRMTNGTVATSKMAKKGKASRMTNGTVAKSETGAMTVSFEGGKQDVVIPADVKVTEIVSTKDHPTQGAAIFFIPQKKDDGSFTTKKITLLAPVAK